MKLSNFSDSKLELTAADKPNILLLTATITPPEGVISLARANPSDRLNDYSQALQFYLSLVDKGVDYIVFSENSNSDISKLETLVEQANLTSRVEFVVCNGLNYPLTYGRGYGEFKLVEHAMNNSKIINNYSHSIIWKITGRYIIRNLNRVIASQPSYYFDIYCNYRNRPRHWTDTYLIAWTPQGYQIGLKNIYQELKEDKNRTKLTEDLLRKSLEQRSDKLKIIPRFKVTPLIEGIRGWNNQSYSQTRELLKYYLRYTANRVMPWWWI